MLTVRVGHLIYLILDALDECPYTSEVPSPRNRIHQLLEEELADLQILNLRICVTSRPEFDIRDFLEPPTSRQVSLFLSALIMKCMTKADKNKIMRIMLGPLFTQSEPAHAEMEERIRNVSELFYVRNTCANRRTGFGGYFVSWNLTPMSSTKRPTKA